MFSHILGSKKTVCDYLSKSLLTCIADRIVNGAQGLNNIGVGRYFVQGGSSTVQSTVPPIVVWGHASLGKVS